MGLDLLYFQGDKDGDPEAIKESQRKRYKSEAIVDEIQAEYKQWTQSKQILGRLCLLTSQLNLTQIK
jgi:hypothetical protein